MTHIHGLNSCFHDNCDKKNNNIKKKKKENDKQGKKKRKSDETWTWDLYPTITVIPQGHKGSLTL